ncbi:MAG: hypothetical protein RBT65_15950 [Methanolobus sp.]|nr:hypothetical protein [Methanolobus sp.]
MKTILSTNILLLFFTFNGLSQEQKVTVKKDLVSVDGSAVFKLVSTNYPDAYTLYNLNNEKLAVFNAQFYSDSKQITPGNPQGRIGYFDITFFNADMDKCEIRIVGAKKQLAQLIISEELIKDEKLNETAVKQFCRIHGMKFSEDRENSGTTIIIKH